MRLQRRAMTLMELLIVIAIIALFGGIAAINVGQIIREERYNSEVQLVIDQLRLAQDLMLLIPADVHVVIKTENEGFVMTIETDAPLEPGWKRELERKRYTLKEIRYASFHDEVPHVIRKGDIDIQFLSGGSVMSRGHLLLSPKPEGGGTQARRICLLGFPSPIDITTEQVCTEFETELYDERLTQMTIEGIMKADFDQSKKNGAASSK